MRSSPDIASDRGPVVDGLPSYDAGPLAEPVENWYGRRGRLSDRSLAEFVELYERFGLATLAAVQAWRPEVLEIGFGTGDSVLGLAEADSTTRILGVDTFPPGVLALMRALDASAVGNVRVIRTNVSGLLPQLDVGQFSLVRVFFPDPWPKRRHAARRLVRPGFVARVEELLAPGGVLHFATDIGAYAAEVGATVHRVETLDPIAAPARATTRFEAHAVKDGRQVHDLAWRKNVT